VAWSSKDLKGLCHGDFYFFWMRNADTQNALRTLREKESNDFLKGKTNPSRFLAIFPGTKEKLENISLMFSSCNAFPSQ